MFGKNKSITELSNSSEMETIIGSETVIQGTISSKGSIRVDGKLEGGITQGSAVENTRSGSTVSAISPLSCWRRISISGSDSMQPSRRTAGNRRRTRYQQEPAECVVMDLGRGSHCNSFESVVDSSYVDLTHQSRL